MEHLLPLIKSLELGKIDAEFPDIKVYEQSYTIMIMCI